jgi:hypothetical protein
MGERDAAQAVALVRALCDLLDEMTRRLTWLERRGARVEAAAMRQDMSRKDGSSDSRVAALSTLP